MSVLEKATQILDVVAETPDGATLTSIAQRLGQPRSSIHRLLSELVQLGLLFRVGPANYVPGTRLARWGEAAGGVTDIVRISKPTMVRLRDAVGESVHLYVRQRDRRVCVSAVEGNYELRHFTEVGKPLPLSVGASGKLLLAFADPATQAQELRRVAREPLTPRAPTVEELTAQLESIRAHRLGGLLRGARGGPGRGRRPDSEPVRRGAGGPLHLGADRSPGCAASRRAAPGAHGGSESDQCRAGVGSATAARRGRAGSLISRASAAR